MIVEHSHLPVDEYLPGKFRIIMQIPGYPGVPNNSQACSFPAPTEISRLIHIFHRPYYY